MKKKLIITVVLLGTFSFANAQSINDITKTANSTVNTAAKTAATTFDVASISNQVMGLLSPKLKLTAAQKPLVNSLVNEILNKKKSILPTLKTNKASYTANMTKNRESFITKMKKLVSPQQFQALLPLLPKSAQSLSPLVQLLY